MSDSGLSSLLANGAVSALAVAFPLVVSMVTGWSIVGAVVGRGGGLEAVSGMNSRFASGVLRVGTGGLLGLWLGTMVVFGVRLAGVGQGQSAVVVGVLDGILMVLAMLAAWWRGGLGVGIRSEKAGFLGLLREWMRASIGVGLLYNALSAACVLTLFHARAAYLQGPLGAFDAIAIWNTKARFLADEQLWRGVFSPQIPWTHPDYPLLLPLNLARLWSYTGLCGHGEPAWCGLVLGLVYLGLALMIVGGTLSLMVSKQRDLSGSSEGSSEAWGLVAALAILGSPGVQSAAVSQMADLPVGAALAGAVACSIMATRVTQTPEKSGFESHRSVAWALLAGLLAGAAAWTKNEGQLMALAVGLAVLWAGVVVPLWTSRLTARSDFNSILRNSLWLITAFVLAFVPTGLLLLGLKLWLVPTNDLLQDQSVAGLSRLIEPARHMQIISGYAVAAKVALGWPLLVVVGVTLVTAIVTPGQRRWAATGALAIPGAVLVLILAGEYGVYLLTPHDLAWHLQTSADRLLVQLWPTIVLTLALACSRSIRPAEADSTKLSAGTDPGV